MEKVFINFVHGQKLLIVKGHENGLFVNMSLFISCTTKSF